MYELGFGSDSRTVRSASSSSFFTVSVWSSSNSNLASSSRCCMVKLSLRLSLLGFAMNYEFEFSVVFVWKREPEMKERTGMDCWLSMRTCCSLEFLYRCCFGYERWWFMKMDSWGWWYHCWLEDSIPKNVLLQVSIGKVFTRKAWKERVFDPFLGQRKWLLRVL